MQPIRSTPPGGARRDYGDPPWLHWVRRAAPWLILLSIAAMLLLNGTQWGAWRTLAEVVRSTGAMGPMTGVVAHWALTVLMAAAVGLFAWTRRGGTPGYGFFSACLAFSLSLAVELVRWFQPGQLPDFYAPSIAAVAAPLVWRLLRFLPEQPVTPLPRHGPCATRRRILVRFVFAGCVAVAAACAIAAGPAIDTVGRAPRQVRDAVLSLPDGRAGDPAAIARLLVEAFQQSGLANWLGGANALAENPDIPTPGWVGATEAGAGVLPPGRLRPVSSVDALRQAIASADPGDTILLQPGLYRLKDDLIRATRPGLAGAPIVLRSARPGLAVVESDLPEAIKVAAPHWRFQNLLLRGVCRNDTDCDAGLHVVGQAEDTIVENTRIEDFNAAIKINAENGAFPDNGRIVHATLIDTHPRQTAVSVVAIDLVGANNWSIEDSLIVDIAKSGGDRVSYGAYAKGAAKGTRFARDVVLCSWHLRDEGGERIGLSFGGGGTGAEYMRDRGASGIEHIDGTMTDNLIAFCSDDGIYLNRAAGSVILRNTLIATSGIDANHGESVARADGNIVDGAIRGRDGATILGANNESTTLVDMFLGRNPVRTLFVAPAALDLRWARAPVSVDTGAGVDLCGVERSGAAPAGAFGDFQACADKIAQPLPTAPPVSGAAAADAGQMGPDARLGPAAAAQTGMVAGTAPSETLHVGKDRPYTTLAQAIAAAAPGDTIEIDPGTYYMCAVVNVDRLTIEGGGDGATLTDTTCSGKGVLVATARDLVLRNLTLARARVTDRNGAGIRAEGTNLTVEHVRFVNNEAGILAALSAAGTIRVTDSEFVDNGACSRSCTPAISAPALALLRVERTKFSGTRGGSDIVSFAARTELVDNEIADGPAGTANMLVDLAGGGDLTMTGNRLEKGPNAGSNRVLVLGSVDRGRAEAAQIVENNTLRDDGAGVATLVLNWGEGSPRVSDNVLPDGVGALSERGGMLHRWHGTFDRAKGFVGKVLDVARRAARKVLSVL